MAPRARIYRRTKNPTQSGKAHVQTWVFEFTRAQPKAHDPLTGWWGSGDTLEQVALTFPSRERAEAYAAAHAIAFDTVPETEHKLKLQAYSDNFR